MIIIPMAGLSSRFREAGYRQPKYELPLAGSTLFAASVRSFERYFDTERFVFVCRTGMEAEAFIDLQCRQLGIKQQVTVSLDNPTRGQAETVLLGLEGAGADAAESLLIFNIDTIRPGYVFPDHADAADGYLEVFEGEGDGWSFVQPAAAFSRRVALTTEKQRISRLCCTGLYHFARAGDFTAICRSALSDVESYRGRWGEVYVAPLYNLMIASGRTVVYHETDSQQVHLSGTPDQYAALCRRDRPLF
jgi:hypothetical protein